MDGMSETAVWALLIPVVGIIGGFVIASLGIYAGIRRREFEHRERLAMIEKGVAPSQTTPPGATAQGTTASATAVPFDDGRGFGYPDRARRGGFIVMAVGLGVGFMMFMTSHDGGAAAGIGGFLVILGAAIFASSFFDGRDPGRSSGTGSGGSRR